VDETPPVLPIFPLANVVLFPRVRTPLHIFEPRYRQMTEAALAGDLRIVMAVIRPAFVGDASGDPPIFDIACTGVIADSQRLPDGRYNLLLQGTDRVRILREVARPAGQLFRCAEVQPLGDPCPPEAAEQIGILRVRMSALVGELLEGDDAEDPLGSVRDIDDAAFVNSLCNALPLSTPEKQALLEADGILGRCRSLIEILEFANAERSARRVPNSTVLH
jgi:Lon protease-like protein